MLVLYVMEPDDMNNCMMHIVDEIASLLLFYPALSGECKPTKYSL